MIGVDEVGRGAWAGPLLVCAVKLTAPLKGLTDSKLLSKNKRRIIAKEIILSNPVGYGWLTADEIDDIGLPEALKLAASKALLEIYESNEIIIVDGNVNFYPLLHTSQAIIKADLYEPAVSAASIVAKVARDNRMVEYAHQYPGYGFENHVGYGVQQHRQAIIRLGLSNIHRKSFKIKL